MIRLFTHGTDPKEVNIDLGAYPDGTPLIKFVPEEIPYIIHWMYDDMGELFTVLCLADKLKQKATEVHLFIPYVPNARMDRVKNPEDVFSLKIFAEMLMRAKFKSLSVCDIHSKVFFDLIDPNRRKGEFSLHIINLFDLFPQVFGSCFRDIEEKINVDVIHFPDRGAKGKYREQLEHLEKPFTFGEKQRDWSTGKITGLTIEGDVEGKDVLIVDDISSYGGTFLHNARALKAKGAKSVNLWIMHCENSILHGELINHLNGKGENLINRVFTTDSIFTGVHEDIQVMMTFRR